MCDPVHDWIGGSILHWFVFFAVHMIIRISTVGVVSYYLVLSSMGVKWDDYVRHNVMDHS
jgi:hypothetical protein